MTAFDRLADGEVPFILIGRDTLPEKPLFLAGSFNPFHEGHAQLLLAAEMLSGREGLLELSITNVDKPPLVAGDVASRLERMKEIRPVVLTRAPTFAEKGELFPNAWFALGYDTAVRLLDTAYHADLSSMLSRFRDLGTRFIVAGRLHEKNFRTLDELNIPSGFEELFTPIPADMFRADISSTQMRSKRRGGDMPPLS